MRFFFLFFVFSAFFIVSCYQKTNEQFFDMAVEMEKEGKYVEAVNLYDKAVELNPKSAKNYFHRAEAKFILKDYIGAINDYTNVIELEPQNKEAYNHRGNSKANLNDYDGAMKDYENAMAIHMQIKNRNK